MNNYLGGTTISAGTLVGNTQSLSGNIVNNATLVFDLTTLGSIFNENISGSGQLIKQNTGTLILTGSNSYTGGTVINDNGVLKGNTFSLTGNITNNGSKLVFDQSYDGVFAGSISGTGQLIKDSTGCSGSSCGKLTLSGDISYTGGTTVTGGSVYSQALNKTFTINGTAFTFVATTTDQIKTTLTAVIQPPPTIFSANPIMSPALPPTNVNSPPPMMASSSNNTQPPPPPPTSSSSSSSGGSIGSPPNLNNSPPPSVASNQPPGPNNQFANPISINIIDTTPPPPPPPPSSQGGVSLQVVEPINKVDPPPPPPLLSAKTTPKDTDSGTNQISTNVVTIPTYSSPKQNVRQLNKTSTQVVTSGLSIQRPSKSAPSSGSTFSGNLSIKGNSSNW
jgi:autotransporter-associated beta strand protein